jgi:hypothetical protein
MRNSAKLSLCGRRGLVLLGTVLPAAIALVWIPSASMVRAQLASSISQSAGVPSVADERATINFTEAATAPLALTTAHLTHATAIHRPLAMRVGEADADLAAISEAGPLSIESLVGGLGQAAPAHSLNFAAGADTGSVTPPDTQGAVGPKHLMVTLNNNVTIQSRTGATINVISIAGFWSSLGGIDEAFDTRVLYDPYANRWIVSSGANPVGTSSAILLGVSETSDPTGGWFLYKIKTDPSSLGWADYPTLGFNGDWIVVQANIFSVGTNGYSGSNIYAFNKADLYGGGAGDFTRFHDPTGYTDYPAVTYDNSLPTEYLLRDWNGGAGMLRVSAITGPVGSEVLTTGLAYPKTASVWQDWATTTNSAPQLGTSEKIDADDARIENCIYRNGSLWAAQTVFLPASAPTRSSVQWWQINTVGGSLGVVQQLGRRDDPLGRYHFAYPTVAVNANSDMMIGYSRFGASQYASANFSYRRRADAPNSLRPDTVIKMGEAPYFKDFGTGDNRWGDYSNTSVDPLNDLDMWTIQEYAGTASMWGTWWGTIKLAATPTATPTRTPTPRPTPRPNNQQNRQPASFAYPRMAP